MALTEESFRSSEEIYMWWWLEDAKLHGIVLDYQYEPEALILVPERFVIVKKYSKTKVPKPIMDKLVLTHEQTYTYDFRIVWNPDYEGRLFDRIDRISEMKSFFKAQADKDGNICSYIDIKGGFAASASTSDVRFPVKQAMAFHIHSIYVQKIVITASVKNKLGRRYTGLFPQVFIPERYLMTDKGKQNRVINFQTKTTKQWLSM